MLDNGTAIVRHNTTTIVANTGTVNASTCEPVAMVSKSIGQNCFKDGCTTDQLTYHCPFPDNIQGAGDLATCIMTQDGSYPVDDLYPDMFNEVLQIAAGTFRQQDEASVSTNPLLQPVPMNPRAYRTRNNEDTHLVARGPGALTPVSPTIIQYNSTTIPSSIAATITQEIEIDGQPVKLMIGSVRFTLTCQDTASSELTCSDLATPEVISSFISLLVPDEIGPDVAAGLGVVSASCSPG